MRYIVLGTPSQRRRNMDGDPLGTVLVVIIIIICFTGLFIITNITSITIYDNNIKSGKYTFELDNIIYRISVDSALTDSLHKSLYPK